MIITIKIEAIFFLDFLRVLEVYTTINLDSSNYNYINFNRNIRKIIIGKSFIQSRRITFATKTI